MILVLFYHSISVSGLFKELIDIRDGKGNLNPRRSRSPRRRQSKTLPSANNEVDRKKNSRSFLLSANKLSHSSLMYNINVTLLLIRFAEGRHMLDG